MRAPVQMDDSGVVDHLHVHNEGVPGLYDLVVAVVGIRKHRRPRRDKSQALILEARLFSALGVLLPLSSAALDVGGCRRERRNAAVGRLRHDGSPEGLDRARTELAIDRVVRAGADVLRSGLRHTLLIVLSHLTFPRCGFFGSEEGFVFQLPWALERRGRGGVPDAVEAVVADVAAGALTSDERRSCRRPGFRSGRRCSGLVCEEERSYQDAAHAFMIIGWRRGEPKILRQPDALGVG